MSLRSANAAAAALIEHEAVAAAAARMRACRDVFGCAAAPPASSLADADPCWTAGAAAERGDRAALDAALASAGARPAPRRASREEAALHAADALAAAAEGYARAHPHEPRAELVAGDRWRAVCTCPLAAYEGTREECERAARVHFAEREDALREALARAGR